MFNHSENLSHDFTSNKLRQYLWIYIYLLTAISHTFFKASHQTLSMQSFSQSCHTIFSISLCHKQMQSREYQFPLKIQLNKKERNSSLAIINIYLSCACFIPFFFLIFKNQTLHFSHTTQRKFSSGINFPLYVLYMCVSSVTRKNSTTANSNKSIK